MPTLLKTLRWLLACLALGYLLLCADVYRKQDALLFPALALDQQRAAQLELDQPGSGYALKTGDGITLRGWLDVPASTRPRPLLLYFGGNKDEVSNWMLMRHQAPDWAWASLNYRGYGASEGKPSQTALVADAQAVFDALAADPRIDPKRIVVIGRSLGSGVAVQLAAKRPLKALILVTPYDSMLSVAAEKYPYLPIRWMLRHPFDSIALAPSLHLPTQILLAENDQLIPPAHGASLAAAWGSPVQPLLLAGASHNNILLHPQFWLDVRGFLQRLGS